ncbi:AlbA family DNA-binding domain-containing protein [Streptomyces cathayae]|uniref:DNA binding domain-containing protein n=1 Tax=Streptomyces cathayae TaxID=3031124 RepID=A0ABY8KC65_9ACTN|nr:RNA-binding domain-containing protein [Streptomyces sp. HUAS 5]WGD45134.1 putative DNA binding domain-containing protein [Streptomyces sp. HUAS 5]
MDLEAVRAALRAQKPDLLLEQPEGQWLDAKKKPYELREPRAVEELAKDVCAFANGGGGVLVLGIGTRVVDDVEILDRFIPVERASVDRDQIRKLIRAHITPAPRGISVEWSGDQQGCRVLYIDIPVQQAGILFVVAAPVGKPGAPRTDTVAVPVREADGTHWLARTEIQRLLSAGVAASGMPTAETLSRLLHEAVTHSASEPAAVRVGQGLPEWEREMREAYEELAGAGLGAPVGEAYRHEAAVLQDLGPARVGEAGWVLCVAPPRPPVVVAAPVWQAILTAGRSDVGGDPLAAVGYPVLPGAGEGGRPWVVTADAVRVDLEGGRWGAGRLVRSQTGGWRWEPAVRFSLEQTRSARRWTSQVPPPQLRLRALVTLPWTDASVLEITKARRQHLEQQLPFSALAGAVTLLSQRRGGSLPAARWQAGPHDNSLHTASYTSVIAAPDGRPAVTAAAMITLPGVTDSAVVSCADVLAEDAAAWAAALGGHQCVPLGFEEVQDVLFHAWETAAELLPAVFGDPAVRRWAAPPTTELRLSAERYDDSGVTPALASFVDFGRLGPGGRGSRQEMAVTITAEPSMRRAERQDVMRRAVVHMAQAFGYVHAEAGLL